MGLAAARGKELELPDGRIVDVPSDFTEKEWEGMWDNLARMFPEEIGKPYYASKRTALGGIGALAAGIPRGVIGTGITAVQGAVGALTPGIDTPIERGLRNLQDADVLRTDDAYLDTWANKIGTGLGSVVPFLLTGIVTGGAGAAALGAAVGAGDQAQRVQGQRDQGNDVTGIGEFAATTLGGVVGLSEAIPVGRYLKRLPGARVAAEKLAAAKTLGAAAAKLSPAARRFNAGMGMAGEALISAGMEGTQEVGALIMQNAIEQKVYNEDMDVSSSLLDEFLVGGAVGGIVDLTLAAMGSTAGGRRGLSQSHTEAAERLAALSEAQTAYMSAVDRLEAAENGRRALQTGDTQQLTLERYRDIEPFDRLGPLGDYVPRLNVEGFEVMPSPTGAGFVIRDRDNGTQVGLPYYAEEGDALIEVTRMEAAEADLAVAASVHLKLDNQGLATSPAAASVGYQATNPRVAAIPAHIAAQYDPAAPPSGAYQDWAKRNPGLSEKASLTPAEVIESIGLEAADKLFVDRARLRSKARIEVEQKLSRDLRENGEPPKVRGDAGYHTELASQYSVSPEAEPSPATPSSLLAAAKEALQFDGSGKYAFKLNARGFNRVTSRGMDPALEYFFESVTGTAHWSDMSNAQKMLAVTALQSLQKPHETIPFPDLSPVLYTDAQRKEVLGLVAGGKPVSAADVITPGAGMTAEAVEQLFRHLEASGVVSLRKDGAIRLRRESLQPGIRTPVDVEAQVASLGMDYFLPENEQGGGARKYIAGQFERLDAEAAESGDDVSPTPADVRADYVASAMEQMSVFMKKAVDRLRVLGLVGDVEVATTEEALGIYESLMDAANGKGDPKKFGAYSPLLGKIAVFQAAVDPDMKLTEGELASKVMATFEHEIFEAIVSRGYLSDAQLEAVFRAVQRNIVPKEVDPDAHAQNWTWYDRAAAEEANGGKAKVEIEREAAADMWAAYATGTLPKNRSAGVVQAAFKMAKRVVTNVNQASAETSLRSALSVFSEINRGLVGAKGPGRDFLNPDGEIRAPKYVMRAVPTAQRSAEIKDAIDAMEIMERDQNLERPAPRVDPAVAEERLSGGEVDPRLAASFDEAATGIAFGFGGAAVPASLPDGAPMPVSMQRDMFEDFLDRATNSQNKIPFLEKAGIPHEIRAEIRHGPKSAGAALHLTLPTTEDPAVTKGVAKLLGDALLQGASEARVVVPFGEMRNKAGAMFGTVVPLPDGVDIRGVRAALNKLGTMGTDYTIERLGDQIVVLDNRSSSEEYDSADAVDFIERLREAMGSVYVPYMEGGGSQMDLAPRGLFVDVTQYAHKDFAVPEASPWNVEQRRSIASAFNQVRDIQVFLDEGNAWEDVMPEHEVSAESLMDNAIETIEDSGLSRSEATEMLPFPVDGAALADDRFGASSKERAAALDRSLRLPSGDLVNANDYANRNFDSEVESFEGGMNELEAALAGTEAERGERGGSETEGIDGPGGTSRLRRSALSDLYELAAVASEAVAFDNVPAGERAYTKPGSAIESPVSDADVAEARAFIDEANADTSYGWVPRFGDMSDIAAKALFDAMRFGATEAAPEIGAVYSSKHVSSPASDKATWQLDYENPEDRSFGMRVIDFLDSPDKYAALKEWMNNNALSARTELLDRHARLREVGAAVNSLRGSKMLANESAEGAAALLQDLVKKFMSDAVKIGPARYVGSSVLEGGMEVDRGGFVGPSGTVYQGIADIWRRLDTPAGNISKYAHAFMTAKRSLELIQAAENASAELAAAKATSTPLDSDRESFLRDTISKAKSLPGGVKVEYTAKGAKDRAAEKARLKNEVVDELAKNHPEILEFEDGMIAVNKWLLEQMVATGQLGKSSHEYKLWSTNTNYIPFTRDMKHVASFASRKSRRVARTRKKLLIEKELEGSIDALDVPMQEAVMANIYGVMIDGAMNVKLNRVVRDLGALGQGHPVSVKEASGDEDIIQYFDDGEKKFYKAGDPLLASSLAASESVFSADSWIGSKIGSGVGRALTMGPANIMRELITRTPGFMARQLARDPISAYVTAGSHKSMASLLGDMKNNLLDSRVYQKAVERGVSLEYDYRNDPQYIRLSMKKAVGKLNGGAPNAAVALWDKLGEISRMTDAATRMAVWDKVFEAHGGTTAAAYEADLQALEVINFGRRGSSKLLSLLFSMVPFMNARLQGLDVMWRSHVTGKYAAIENGMSPDEIRYRAFARGSFLMMATAAYWLMMSDSEEYENTRKEVREDNWLIPIPGTTQAARYPIPFEVGVIYKALPELLLNSIKAEDPKAMIGGTYRQFKKSANISLVPQFAAPLVDVRKNKNPFTGNPITPYYAQDNLLPGDRYTHFTNRLAVVTGKAVGASPMALEYMLQAYLPGMAVYAAVLADAIARGVTGENIVGSRGDLGDINNMPFVEDMVTDQQGGHQQAFYDLKKEVDEITGSLARMRREGDVDGYRTRREAHSDVLSVKGQVDALSKWMTEWRRHRDAVTRNQTMTAAQRRSRLNDLEAMRDRQLAIVPSLKKAARGR